jgi:hypothetical protein
MQYFYLVVINYDESTYPKKIFLQENQAIQWGRRKATQLKYEGCYEVALYKQEITRLGELKFVKNLEPYEGVDYDIDKHR